MTPPPPPPCDLLILTAVSSEKKALQETAAELGVAFDRRKSLLGPFVDLGMVGLRSVLAVETTMGPFSASGSASKALQWLSATRAQAVLGVGMAFGTLPRKQTLGDVLVSTALLPYDYKVIRCGVSDEPTADYSGLKASRSNGDLLALFERAVSARRGAEPPVHFGRLLSGGTRIHCSRYRDELVDALMSEGDGPIVGGDMEGVGLLSVSDDDNPRWMIVKGISDFACERRDAVIEDSRPAACRNAARFVLSALLAEETLHAPSR